MIDSKHILAAIVVYHPDDRRLQENINSIHSQVDEVAVFDNGSTDLDTEYPDYPSITILSKSGVNIGIASALNALCEYALEKGYEWVLTLDQDSIVPNGYIDGLRPYMDNPKVGLLCPSIKDRNYGSMSYDTGDVNAVDEVDACITSGSLLRLSAWQKIHGFWDELFIDMVDFDLCWSLQEAGFKLLRVNHLSLLHEIGNSRRVTLLGKENVVYNHPPIRCYYITRNTFWVGKKHHRMYQCLRWITKRIILINLFERGRWQKDKMIVKGIKEGIKFKV